MCIYLGLYWIIGAAVVAAVVVDGNSKTGWDRYLAVVPTYSAIMCCRSIREVRRGLGGPWEAMEVWTGEFMRDRQVDG